MVGVDVVLAAGAVGGGVHLVLFLVLVVLMNVLVFSCWYWCSVSACGVCGVGVQLVLMLVLAVLALSVFC